MRNVFIVLVGLLLNSCSNKTAEPANGFILEIQPMSQVSESVINDLFSDLKKYYPQVRIRKKIPLPQAAYYAPRKRYRADSILNYLDRNTRNGIITIGLTEKDISTTNEAGKDWGIMGLGKCPGKVCIISSYRLTKNLVREQLFKVAIHELGHTQGLNHCEVKSCYMRDAKGKNPTNEEKGFCEACMSYMVAKGWKLDHGP